MQKAKKEYFCKQINGLEVCGETNPEMFPLGRYSSCKKCRNKSVREHLQELRQVEKEKENIEYLEKFENPNDIKMFVHDTILRYPLIEGKSVNRCIEDIENDILFGFKNVDNTFKEYNSLIEKLSKKVEEVITENQLLKKEIIGLKNILQNKNIYNFEDQ